MVVPCVTAETVIRKRDSSRINLLEERVWLPPIEHRSARCILQCKHFVSHAPVIISVDCLQAKISRELLEISCVVFGSTHEDLNARCRIREALWWRPIPRQSPIPAPSILFGLTRGPLAAQEGRKCGLAKCQIAQCGGPGGIGEKRKVIGKRVLVQHLRESPQACSARVSKRSHMDRLIPRHVLAVAFPTFQCTPRLDIHVVDTRINLLAPSRIAASRGIHNHNLVAEQLLEDELSDDGDDFVRYPISFGDTDGRLGAVHRSGWLQTRASDRRDLRREHCHVLALEGGRVEDKVTRHRSRRRPDNAIRSEALDLLHVRLDEVTSDSETVAAPSAIQVRAQHLVHLGGKDPELG
mmetsp:Transcript_67170/g.218682  ORF Transcript_67170/g.218682 Transcript_67170/m.218682 type:complete len:353 (+) Transcript_67170:894-1952(+)